MSLPILLRIYDTKITPNDIVRDIDCSSNNGHTTVFSNDASTYIEIVVQAQVNTPSLSSNVSSNTCIAAIKDHTIWSSSQIAVDEEFVAYQVSRP